jgi:uncharacterized membrane protein
MVEALTIVLAVGYAHSRRAAFTGSLAAALVLIVAVAAFGPVLAAIPIVVVRIVVGCAALYFGWKWLRKAVERYAGVRAMRDEAANFARDRAAFATRNDREATITAFNGVLLEGVEVVVIVLSLGGATPGAMLPAAGGAFAALVLTALVGVAVRKPLARVPENLMKTAVGVMLLAFGTFWLGEGLGIAWPHDDLALAPIVAFYALLVALAVRLVKRRNITSS